MWILVTLLGLVAELLVIVLLGRSATRGSEDASGLEGASATGGDPLSGALRG